MTRNGVQKISKRDWQARGGLRNSALFRKADRRGRWSYYIDWRHS